jgi:hypothetical protein
MSGRMSSFFFSIPQEQNRLKYSPVAKILSRIFSSLQDDFSRSLLGG